MTRYDTQAQYQAGRERRWIGIGVGIAMLVLAAYLIVDWVYIDLYGSYPETTFELTLAILVIFLSLVPFSAAFIRRPHPVSLEVRRSGLLLNFQDGKSVELGWSSPPIDYAQDLREVRGRHARPPGLEVVLWVTLPGPYPESTPFRPQELFLSAAAFDEVAGWMKGAGYSLDLQAWRKRRPGKLVQFVRKGEKPTPAPPVALRRW